MGAGGGSAGAAARQRRGPADRQHQPAQRHRPALPAAPPHRSLPRRATPAAACAARPKAVPGSRTADTHHRVRADIIGATGTLTLRHAGPLHHIGVGRTHAGTRILMLVQDLHIRIIHAATGELLRELTLDPSRNYQPAGRPPGPTPPPPRNHRHPAP
jgi:hypothetical protein